MEKMTIQGNPPSKSNCYRIIRINGHGSLAKTAALKKYEDSFYMQCPIRDKNISSYFELKADVFFSSMRPDLDNAFKVILDCLERCKAIKNDRLCVAITARKFVDKNNPRVELTLTAL